MMKQVVTLGLLILLTACSFAPKTQTPAMPIPTHFKATEVWKPARTVPLEAGNILWWKMFDDPILNDMEARLQGANQDLKAAFARYQNARAVLQSVSSALFPTVTAIAGASRQQISTTTANSSATTMPLFNNFLLASEVSYILDLWGQVRNSIAASKSLVGASAADLDAIALSLHSELAIDYMTLRGYESMQAVLDRTVVAYQKALYLTRQRHSGGAVPISDVDQAIAQLENAKTAATDMRLKRAQLENAIAVLLGDIPSNFTMPKSNRAMKKITMAPYLPSALLERRPDIAAAEYRVKAANAQIGVACAAFFPQVDLISLAGFQSATIKNLFNHPSLLWSLGPSNLLSLTQPMIEWTVFDGGNLRGLLNQAKSHYFETVAIYRQTVLTAFQEVEDNLVAIRRLDQEYQSQQLATQAAERALMQARYQYKGGIITFLEVVVVEDIALQAELASISIQIRRQIASIQLIKALGGGWAGNYVYNSSKNIITQVRHPGGSEG
jgi:NodT family efflux transporter outer membrane factor (OMF) lipoprotein